MCTYDSGCTDPNAYNYDSLATVDDGTCLYCDWDDPLGTTNGSHIYTTVITDEDYPNANNGAIEVTIASTTPYTIVHVELLDSSGAWVNDNNLPYGSTVSTFTGLPPAGYYVRVTSATFTGTTTSCLWDGYLDNGQMHTVNQAPAWVYGCTDPTACNFEPLATSDDGSCILPDGCTDPTAFNYDPTALCDDNSCIPVVNGCTDPTALNYDPSANVNDNSCTYDVYGCMDSRPRNDLATDGNGALIPAATNYDATATRNEVSDTDDSDPCEYTIEDNGVYPPMSAEFQSPQLISNNFFYNANTDNWYVKLNNANNKNVVYAVFDVSSLPLIQWPGYHSDGTLTSTCNQPQNNQSNTATAGTRFSYETARDDSTCEGDLTRYYGGECISGSSGSGFRWYYSTDNGSSWADGNTLTYTNGIPNQAIELVRFYKAYTPYCSSGLIDWTNYTYAYDGKFKQDARFSFLEWDWNVGINQYTEQPQGIAELSTSKDIQTGCKASIVNPNSNSGWYCNTSGAVFGGIGVDIGVNYPTDSTYNPCSGNPGCNDSSACNTAAASCFDNNNECIYPLACPNVDSNGDSWDVGIGDCYAVDMCTIGATCGTYSSHANCCQAYPNTCPQSP
jgi:hypothetical protein